MGALVSSPPSLTTASLPIPVTLTLPTYPQVVAERVCELVNVHFCVEYQDEMGVSYGYGIGRGREVDLSMRVRRRRALDRKLVKTRSTGTDMVNYQSAIFTPPTGMCSREGVSRKKFKEVVWNAFRLASESVG